MTSTHTDLPSYPLEAPASAAGTGEFTPPGMTASARSSRAAERPYDRKVLVVVNDGGDNTSVSA